MRSTAARVKILTPGQLYWYSYRQISMTIHHRIEHGTSNENFHYWVNINVPKADTGSLYISCWEQTVQFPSNQPGSCSSFLPFYLSYLSEQISVSTLIFPSFCVLIASFSPAHSQDSLSSEDTVLNFSHWNCSLPRRWKCNIASPPPPFSLLPSPLLRELMTSCW